MFTRKWLQVFVCVVIVSVASPLLSGEWSYYVNDHLGNTRVVLDESGNVKSYYDYYPFGLKQRSLVTGDDARFKFTGKELDDEFGLGWYYYGARFYDPEIGRWIAVDPLAGKYPHSSPYVYGANNPLRFIDPDGRDLEAIPGQLAALYATTGAAAAVIVADDITGVGVVDDVALPVIGAVAGVGTVGIIVVNAVDELVNIFQQRTGNPAHKKNQPGPKARNEQAKTEKAKAKAKSKEEERESKDEKRQNEKNKEADKERAEIEKYYKELTKPREETDQIRPTPPEPNK